MFLWSPPFLISVGNVGTTERTYYNRGRMNGVNLLGLLLKLCLFTFLPKFRCSELLLLFVI